jgi:hypothetical protein
VATVIDQNNYTVSIPNPSNQTAFFGGNNGQVISTAVTFAGHASGSHFTAGDTSPIMAGTDGFLYRHIGFLIQYTFIPADVCLWIEMDHYSGIDFDKLSNLCRSRFGPST